MSKSRDPRPDLFSKAAVHKKRQTNGHVYIMLDAWNDDTTFTIIGNNFICEIINTTCRFILLVISSRSVQLFDTFDALLHIVHALWWHFQQAVSKYGHI